MIRIMNLAHVFNTVGQSGTTLSRCQAGKRHNRRAIPGAKWLLWCALLCAASGWAQTTSPTALGGMSIEDLAKLKVDAVYGASKFLQKAGDVPGSITIVTAEEIQKYGYRTLADVLRGVGGFYVIYDRNYSYVGVRGFSRPGDYNARILFLLDGHRVNENIYDGAYVGTEFPVNMGLIDRIEIIRGPSSSVYGTGAFVAVVNVITIRGRDLNSVQVAASAGSWNSYKTRITYGDRFENGFETLLSGSFYNSQGHPQLYFPEFDSPATNNGIAENADGDRSYNIFADLIYRDFNLHVVQASRTKHIPTASFGTVFNDPRTLTTDARGYVDLQYQHTSGKWETLGRISYDWYNYNGVYIYDYTGKQVPPFTQNIDLANGTWWDLQLDASRVFLKRHRITLGGEFRDDIRQEQANYDLQPYVLYLDDHRGTRLWAFYVQDHFSIRKNLTLVAELRTDWYQKFGNSLSPRVGVIFKPAANTDLKAFYSHAFRAPNSYENYYVSSVSNSDNPSLQPERIHSFEVDLVHRFSSRLSGSASGFINHIDGLIAQGIDPLTGSPLYMNAAGDLQTKGIELELRAKWPDGTEGVISQSMQDSRDQESGDVLTNSPKQLTKAHFSLPLWRRSLFADVEAQYTSRRRTLQQTDLGGFLVANVTLLARNFGKGFDISASLYNVFDKRYADSGGLEHLQASIPQDGRSFRVKLSYRLGSKLR